MLIYKKYFFDSAHYLENFKKGHEYNNVHGHSYEVVISIDKILEKKQQWVMNFDELDKIVNPLIQILDHNILNEVDGLDNPTSENIARWFWKNIKSKIKDLKSVEIIRPRIGGCIYKGD